MAKQGRGSGDGQIIIKKYANRRLYNTDTSSYITLEDLARMTREGRDFIVLDAKSNDDITHNVLTQIIMESEQKGATMLPANFLRQLISMYGDSMQAMVPQYLEASMESFRRNHDQFRTAIEGAMSKTPFGEIAKRNLEMFEAATSAFRPKTPDGTKADATKDDEIASLKDELKQMQQRLDKLA